MSRSRRSVTLAVAVIAALGLAACGPAASSGGDASASGPATELSLVGFAVPKAGNDAAQKLWGETSDGAGVTWTTSYGASGDQSRAVVAGLKADYVHFSLEGDVTRLVDEGLVAEDWNAGPTQGIVSDSVVVLVVRKGNPKNIQTSSPPTPAPRARRGGTSSPPTARSWPPVAATPTPRRT